MGQARSGPAGARASTWPRGSGAPRRWGRCRDRPRASPAARRSGAPIRPSIVEALTSGGVRPVDGGLRVDDGRGRGMRLMVVGPGVLASATVDGPRVGPAGAQPRRCCFGIGHDLARHGEAVFRIGPGGRSGPGRGRDGRRAGRTRTRGRTGSIWSGPTMTEQRTVPAAGRRFTFGTRRTRSMPWRGRPPIAIASPPRAGSRLASKARYRMRRTMRRGPWWCRYPRVRMTRKRSRTRSRAIAGPSESAGDRQAAGFGDRAGAPARDWRPDSIRTGPPGPPGGAEGGCRGVRSRGVWGWPLFCSRGAGDGTASA